MIILMFTFEQLATTIGLRIICRTSCARGVGARVHSSIIGGTRAFIIWRI